MDDETFLDRCAEAAPEDAALMMALYNEGVRMGREDVYADFGGDSENLKHWYEVEATSGIPY